MSNLTETSLPTHRTGHDLFALWERWSASPVLCGVVVWLAFLLSRGILFLGLDHFQPSPDTTLYAHFAHLSRAAAKQGTNVYVLNDKLVTEQLEQAKKAGQTPKTEESKSVEYPPLALVSVILPSLFMERLPEEEAPLTVVQYVRRYRLQIALYDLLTFLLLGVLVRRWYAQESVRERTERLLIYVLSGAILGYMLYDRLDLTLGALLLLAVALLTGSRYYLGSFLVLAAAIWFKLIPLVLIPIWVLASLPADILGSKGEPPQWGRAGLAIAMRLGILGALIALIVLPFYLAAGPSCWSFLAYHTDRGLEVESTYASILMALGPLGHTFELYFSHGSFNLRSPLSPLLTQLSVVVMAGCFLFALGLVIRAFFHFARSREWVGSRPTRLGQLRPDLVIVSTLLFLMVLMVASKVLSPQYLLWLVPLVPLVPLAGTKRRVFLWGFLALCALTTALMPFLFRVHILGMEKLPSGKLVLHGPTLLGTSGLLARNLLVVAYVVGLAGVLIGLGRARGSATPEGGNRE
jgi:hypothetical protein